MDARAVRGVPAVVGLVVMGLLPACSKQSAPSAVESLTAKAAIDSLWAGYAHASDEKDLAAFGSLFTEDAVVDYSSAPTARGRDAIKTFLGSLYKDIDPVGLRIEPDETRVSGATAVQSGVFQERFIERNIEKTEYGRFVLVAERAADGTWKIRRLMAIADSTTAD